MKVRQILTISYALIAISLITTAAFAQDPGVLKFDERSFEVAEDAGMVTVVVERSKGEDGAVSVGYSTRDGSAQAGQDYTATSGTLSWTSGDDGNKTFTVPILSDDATEGAESFEVVLSNPTGGATLDAERGTASVVILSNQGGGGDDGPGDDGPGDDGPGDDGPGDDGPGDDGPGDDGPGDDGPGDDGPGDDGPGDDGPGDAPRAGVLKFDQRSFEALERSRMAVITVERSKGERGAVTVDYSTADGTATAGDDYTPVSGTLRWGANDGGRRTFTIPILDDSSNEGRETVRLRLSNPTGGAAVDAARGTAVLTLSETAGEDNGGGSRAGTFKFDERSVQAIEGSGSATIVVERSGGQSGAVSVGYATADGSATGGADYRGVSGTLSWSAGDSGPKTFTIPLVDDNLEEGNETVHLTLRNPTGGARLDDERGASALTIVDDDGSTTACIDNDSTLCLLTGRFQVEVVWRTSDGASGSGHVVKESDQAGLVWFFDDGNFEMLVKMLDACSVPGFGTYWVFFAATTNVDFTVTVTDTQTGVVREYANPLGQAAVPVQDLLTFDTCP